MPKEVDIQHRRTEFAAATWRIIMDEGLSAATMRRIAAETQCTTGALTHYFTNREALLVEALRRAHIAAARLIEAASKASGDLARLEVVLVEALPLDSQRMKEWKTRLAVWAAASDNGTLRRENSRRYQGWNDLLEEYLAPIVSNGSERRREAILLMGLVDGLALRLLLHAPRGAGMQAPVSEVIDEMRFHLRALKERYW
jgi:AcrR family transcriptional regulator